MLTQAKIKPCSGLWI